jgi:chromosome segregation ATPase
VELSLFRLFHNERDIEEITSELDNQQGVVQRIEQSKEAKEEELKEKKKEQGKIGREMAKIEQEIREIVKIANNLKSHINSRLILGNRDQQEKAYLHQGKGKGCPSPKETGNCSQIHGPGQESLRRSHGRHC